MRKIRIQGNEAEEGTHDCLITSKILERDVYNMSEKNATRSIYWKDWILSCIYGTLMIVQVGFTYFYYNYRGLDLVVNAGWLFLTVSGVFGWMPIFTFRRKGGVPEGKSYMYTTVLVDSGIYSIVRHPQFFAGILISFALILISQYWVNAILFVPVIVGTYIDSLRADKDLIEKFGDDYKLYMKRVSGLNPLVGISVLLRQREE